MSQQGLGVRCGWQLLSHRNAAASGEGCCHMLSQQDALHTHILYNYIIQLYIVGYVGYKLIAREGQSIAVPSGQARALHSKESCLERTDQ